MMRHRKQLRFHSGVYRSLVGICLFGLACTDATLFIPPELLEHPLDNKIELTGGFCAEGSSDLEAFLKIMLIIDRSNSMNITDRNNQRITAAADLVARFMEDPTTKKLRRGVEFAVLSFWGNVAVHTRDERGLAGYSNDGPAIIFALTQLAQTSSNTGYDKALAQAFLMIDTDMARMSDTARALSRYETIFLSDGMPYPDQCAGEANSPTAAVGAAARIQSLTILHKVPHSFHTAFVSDPAMFTSPAPADCATADPLTASAASIGDKTRSLLEAMARVGKGTFTQFDSGDAISFQGFEFADARRIYSLSSFITSNLSAIPDMDRVLPDSDRDGLSDEMERIIGSSPFIADTDGDGFNDALEWRFRLNGFDPLDPTDAVCPEIGRVDTDGDGLLDCEESFSGTFRRTMDSDNDGLPDLLEVHFGTNANSATPFQDLQMDSDADGAPDGDELRWHTDPQRNDVAFRSRIAYRYHQRELPITTGRACYDFTVTNISLASTETPPAYQTVDGVVQPPGWNRIMLYFAQTPYDDPVGDPLYRLACVDARYVESRDLKMPPGGRFDIPPVRPADTYEPTEVLRPNDVRCNASVNQDCGIDTRWCRFNDDGAGTCRCYDPPRAIDTNGDGIPDSFPDPIDGADYNGDGIADPSPCPACANGIDDDADGFTDFPNDPDCYNSTDNNENSPTAAVNPGERCSDGVDNDGDNRIDWPYDPGCDSFIDNDESDDPPGGTECSDGIDNDQDNTIDFPGDIGCYSAQDDSEDIIEVGCDDGVDNDGDGLTDLIGGGDPGCSDANDVTEEGPAVCFFCEKLSQNRPGQCDIGEGFCKAVFGTTTRPVGICPPLPPPTSPPADECSCTSDVDCRGSVCNTTTGVCGPCLRDRDCASGYCNSRKGWCMTPVYSLTTCTSDTDCSGTCDIGLGLCEVDPYWACRNDKDCMQSEVCAKRGFCLTRVYDTKQCDASGDCAEGACDLMQGWCLPTEESDQCGHNDECPFGDCIKPANYCQQQTFVFPEDFRPEVDCLRAR